LLKIRSQGLHGLEMGIFFDFTRMGEFFPLFWSFDAMVGLKLKNKEFSSALGVSWF
jgi:hypothetical protein